MFLTTTLPLAPHTHCSRKKRLFFSSVSPIHFNNPETSHHGKIYLLLPEPFYTPPPCTQPLSARIVLLVLISWAHSEVHTVWVAREREYFKAIALRGRERGAHYIHSEVVRSAYILHACFCSFAHSVLPCIACACF